MPDNGLHQRRLASAIAADQTDAASRRDRSRRALKDRPPAEADRNSVNSQHARARSIQSWHAQGVPAVV